MHEVGLACDIVSIVEQFARRNAIERVECIELQVGEFSGVVPEALRIGFVSACKGTICEDAELAIQETEGFMKCSRCGAEFKIVKLTDPCPDCGSDDRRIVAGNEFKILSIDV